MFTKRRAIGAVSPELRAALDDPRTRYLIVEAWRRRTWREVNGNRPRTTTGRADMRKALEGGE